jgi:hypothetical protein
MDISFISLDENQNIYATFLFDSFDFELDGISIYNNLKPSNAIVKWDKNGNILWLKNSATPWTDDYGETKAFIVDSLSNLIISIQSQSGYGTSSTCRYKDWTDYIQVRDINGNFIKSKSIVCNDLAGIEKAILLDNGKLFFCGYFRGVLIADEFTLETPKDESGCSSTYFYTGIYDIQKNRIENIVSYPENYSASDISKDEEYIYTIGAYNTKNKKQLCIYKYNYAGVLVGYKTLREKDLYFIHHNLPKISLNNKHISINFQDLAETKKDIYTTGNYWGVFETNLKFLKSEIINNVFPLNNIEDLNIFPNPTFNVIYVPNKNYDSYVIFNSIGQQVIQNKFVNSTLETIDVSNLNNGIYFLKVLSNEKHFSIKFIKR